MAPLSVTIITLNEERNLPGALASVSGIADEVIVVDSGSTDGTRDIAQASGARFITREWTDYSQQKNYAAEQATHDWILSLDADERLSAELRDSLAKWKQQEPKQSACSVSRRNNYLGAWVRHGGWYPDRKARLYDRRRARFVGAVHESLRVKGTTGQLDGDLLHYTMRNPADHRRTTELYSTLSAAERFAQGRRRWLLPLMAAPVWSFLRGYVLQLGFLDGWRGWRIARMTALYSYLKYKKLGRLIRENAADSPSEAKP